MRGPANSDWKAARRKRRAEERRLPPGLRHDVRVVRRDDLAAGSDVLEDAAAIASRTGATRVVNPIGEPPWSYVPPTVEREILGRLDENPTYRQQVRAEIDRTLRSEHMTRVDPAAANLAVPLSLGPVPKVNAGRLYVESNIGLGTASVVEAEPEAWNHWVAQEIARSAAVASGMDVDDVGLGGEPHGQVARVLVIGALAGGFARVVTAMGAAGANILVTEHDWVLATPTNVPCVIGRSGLAELRAGFDAVVLVMPSPATPGASNYRHIYNPERPYDPARLGTRRWKRDLIGLLGMASTLLHEGGLLYALLPLGVRFHRGYVPAPDLLDEALFNVQALGFEVVEKIPTIEVLPVAQPFVGKNRPPKITLVLRKTQPVEGM